MIKETIKQNADKYKKNISKHCRDSAMREELTNNQLAFILMMFIGRKISESSISPDKKMWSKHKLEQLKEKLKKPLDINFAGMSEEEKMKFEKHWAEKREEYSKMANEISEVLERFYVEG